MAIEIHKEPLYRRYYASVCSWSFLYIVIVWFLIIFLPLIIAYNSSNFWIKTAIVYEQPTVSYRYETLSEIYGQNVDTGDPVNLFFSTSPRINELYETTFRMAKLASIEQDDNNDGKVDRLELNLVVPLASNEVISGMSAIVYHDVQINAEARYIFDAMSYFHHESYVPISRLEVDGDLLIRQSWNFDTKGGYKNPYDGEPLLAITSTMSANAYSISNIMKASNARNFSLSFDTRYQYAQRMTSRPQLSDKELNVFNATITMRIPVQPIRYTPVPSVLLKNAWIQYVAYLIVVTFLLTRLNSFVFRHQLLYVRPVADIVVEKMD